MARYALVVGISQYCSPLKSLEKTATDAEAVAQVLEEYGDFVEVKRLPSRRNPQTQKREMVAKVVTGAELGQALQTLLLEQACQNEALIYFTGHGITVPGNLGQPRGYLATSDCEIEAEGQQIINQKHGIAFDDLNDLISKSELSSLVVLLDCCHSGHFLERNLIERTFRTFSTQKDYYLITAGRSFQPVYARRNEPHSVFTSALLTGLAAQNADSERRVSGDRLFDHISRELRGTEQEPLRLGWGKSLTWVTHPPLVVPPSVDVPATTAVNRENPYLGLRAFDSGQADYFFGRILAVRALLDRLNNSRFLAVIGASGCGKSSLVKAGLLPYLKSDHIPGSSQWIIESFTPGTRPLESLQKALEQQQQNQPLLLFIDQFEEVFTLCEDETERREFICRITQEATSSDRLTRVIVAMRGDFLDRCAAYEEAAVLINRTQPTTYFVTPFTLPELEEVIEKPADKHGVTLERGLVPQIIADVMNQPGGLPLLQYALAELWRVCITESPPNSQLTCKGYEQIRGVKGALEKRANDLYQNLAPADKVFVRRLFLALVQLGEAKEVTRRRATWQELEVSADSQEQLLRVTRQLASQEQRLIITDEKTVEVAHEALLSEWGRLKEWVEQDRENLRLSRRLEVECKEWQRNDCSEGLLLTDAWLAAIADWVEKTQPRLSQLEQEFLQESLEKRDRELEAKVEQERQLRELAESRQREAEAKAKAEKQRTQVVMGGGIVVAVLLTLLGLLQFQAKNKEIQTAKIGEIRALIVSSETNLRTNNQLEALLASVRALDKLEEAKIVDADALNRLQAITQKAQERNRLEGHTLSVNGVSFSPNSKDKLIVSASSDKTVMLWKLGNTSPKVLKGHTDKVWIVNFSPDGQYIASASADKTIKIWNKKGLLINTLTGHNDDVNYVAFSPDNRTIISASSDKTMRLWKLNRNLDKVIKTEVFKEHDSDVFSAVFSPDGQFIASASDDKTIKVWKSDGTSLTSLVTLKGHEDTVRFASFGLDGRTLVSVSDDNTIRLWQRTRDSRDWRVSNVTSTILTRESDRSQAIHYSPNGQLIAATNADGTVKVWKSDGTPLKPVTGHKGQVNDLSFSPDSKKIATASRDRTIRVWNLDSHSSNFELNSYSLLKRICNNLYDYLLSNFKQHQDEYEACRDISN